MRASALLAAVIGAQVAIVGATASAEQNLVPNGSFEKGKGGIPESWQRPDGLTSFWVKDPDPKRAGMCLRIDTDVDKQEYRAREDELKKDPNAPAKPKTPTSGDKYDTVAGVEGVSYYSDWMAVAPGQTYKLEVDVRTAEGKKTPKLFVKGYIEDPRRPEPYRWRVAYKKFLDCPADGTWKTFGMTFQPAEKDPKVARMRVMIFGYWPPGIYYFDNVKVVPVEAGKETPSARPNAPPGKQPSEPPKEKT